jgi:hypothetical protein
VLLDPFLFCIIVDISWRDIGVDVWIVIFIYPSHRRSIAWAFPFRVRACPVRAVPHPVAAACWVLVLVVIPGSL